MIAAEVIKEVSLSAKDSPLLWIPLTLTLSNNKVDISVLDVPASTLNTTLPLLSFALKSISAPPLLCIVYPPKKVIIPTPFLIIPRLWSVVVPILPLVSCDLISVLTVFVVSVTVNFGVLASLKSISPVKVGLAIVLLVSVCEPVSVATVESIFKVTVPDVPPPDKPVPAVTPSISPVAPPPAEPTSTIALPSRMYSLSLV